MKVNIKNLRGEDLDYGVLPSNPEKFHDQFYLDVEANEQNATIRLGFNLITTGKLVELNSSIWGWGCLIMPRFSWETLAGLVRSQVLGLTGDTWEETVRNLAMEFYVFEESSGAEYPIKKIRGRST